MNKTWNNNIYSILLEILDPFLFAICDMQSWHAANQVA